MSHINPINDPMGQNNECLNNPGQHNDASAAANIAGAPPNHPAGIPGQMNPNFNQGLQEAGGGGIPDMAAAMMNNMWPNPMMRMQLMQNMPFWRAGMLPMGMMGMVSGVPQFEAR